jgi:hypothetical protein
MSDTAPPVIPGLRPEPRRDRYGRYLLAHPGTGELRPWTRATTLAHTLDDTHHLTQWKRRMVLQGIATDPTLLDGVASLVSDLKYADGYEARDLKKAIDERCDAAANAAGANDGSGWGTALHAVTEWFDAGRIDEIDVPIELLADLAAYEQCMTENGITRPTDHIERIVVNTTTDTAGTYDRLVKMPDGRILVGDLKTQQRIFDWLGIAIQLAQYAHADCVYNPDGTPSPLPDELDVTTGIVFHLPARSGACQLYEVDLVAGWQAAQTAVHVRTTRGQAKGYGKPWVTNQHPRTVEDAGDGLMAAITLAPDVDTLTRLWNQAGPAGRWTDAHTDAAIHRKRQLAGREHARRELAAMRESAMRGAA